VLIYYYIDTTQRDGSYLKVKSLDEDLKGPETMFCVLNFYAMSRRTVC